ncbi:MAG: M23 family metallopeptidase [Desulfomonilaceae bacterium]
MKKGLLYLGLLLAPFLAACSSSVRLQEQGHSSAGVGISSLARFCSLGQDGGASKGIRGARDGASRSPVSQAQQNRVQNPLAGNLRFPIDNGCLSSPFGYRRGVFHSGLDITADPGEPIHACADGEVVFAGTMKKYRSYGKMVLIDHGEGVLTRYAHASKILVKPGQKVKMGQQIALVGKTGRATAPHLHLEIEVRGRLYNPLTCFSDYQLREVKVASGFPAPPLGPIRSASQRLGRVSLR